MRSRRFIALALLLGPVWLPASGLAQDPSPEQREQKREAERKTREEEAEWRHGAAFGALNAVDARGHLDLSLGALLEPSVQAVPLRMDFSFALPFRTPRPETVWGLYGRSAVTKRAGTERPASALSNLDVGFFFARELTSGWWVSRTGLLLPTADEDDVGAALNAVLAPQRPADTVLFQPAALGGRLSGSLILVPPCGALGCTLRLDGGLDVYAPTDDSVRLALHWGAGWGLRTGPVVTTLEYSGTRSPQAPREAGTLRHRLGGSLRFIARPRGIQPGLVLLVPVHEQTRSVFLALDLLYRGRSE